MSSTGKALVVKGELKLKKGDLFKKKKAKTIDPKMIDLTIKKNETARSNKTAAEIAFEKRQDKNMWDRLQKKAVVSHREKVEKFNKQMGELTEFNDIPKVSWTK